MTSDIKKILEIADDNKIIAPVQQPAKYKSTTYKKLPVHPFLKQHGKFQQFVSPFNPDLISTPYPPFSNLSANELYKQQQSINNIIGKFKPINVSEMRYYKYIYDTNADFMLCYGTFLHVIRAVLHFELQFVKAADFLQYNVFDVMSVFLQYSQMVVNHLNTFTIKQNNCEFMRCYQLLNHFIKSVQSEAKIQEQREKHFSDLVVAKTDVYNAVGSSNIQQSDKSANKQQLDCNQTCNVPKTAYQQILQQQLTQIPDNFNKQYENRNKSQHEQSEQEWIVFYRDFYFPYMIDRNQFTREQTLLKTHDQLVDKNVMNVIKTLDITNIIDQEFSISDSVLGNIFNESFKLSDLNETLTLDNGNQETKAANKKTKK